jgi:hypothetical protein
MHVYGVVTTVEAPIEMYHGLHAELGRRVGPVIDGVLVHVGRTHGSGFEVLEVWESKEHCDRAGAEIVFPLMRELAGGQAPEVRQQTETFDVRGLVIPGAAVFI